MMTETVRTYKLPVRGNAFRDLTGRLIDNMFSQRDFDQNGDLTDYQSIIYRGRGE